MTHDEILEKYGLAFENFCPAPGSAIKITVNTDKVDINQVAVVADYLQELYPEHSIFTTFKGIDIK